MTRFFPITAILGFLATAAVAAEPLAPKVLSPLSSWSVDYGKDRCRAARTFGDKAEPSVLIIDVYGPRTAPSWIIAGPAVRGMGGKPNLATVRFGALEPAFKAKDLEFVKLGDFGNALTASRFSGSQDADPNRKPTVADGIRHLQGEDFEASQGQSIAHVDLSVGERVTRLATGPMSELFKVLANCTDTIVSEWGYDPAVERALTRRAEPVNKQDFVKPIIDSYPVYAAAIGAQTLVRMRVAVDAAGAPTGCTLVEMLDASAFNDYACKVVLRKARFTPALDAEGQPVASYWETQIRYYMP